MKNKIIISLLICLIALNTVGCGCGTATTSTDAEVEVIETEVIETESEIVMDTEEPTEISEESTEVASEEDVTETPEEIFESYLMFTNTQCNMRSQASKDSEIVGSCGTNTSVTVIEIEGDWSKVEYNGLQAYIKSSLLSKDKVVVSQPSSSSNTQPSGGTQTQSQPQQTAPAPQQTQPQTPQSNPADPPSSGATFGDIPTGGTTGSSTAGESLGGAY